MAKGVEEIADVEAIVAVESGIRVWVDKGRVRDYSKNMSFLRFSLFSGK